MYVLHTYICFLWVFFYFVDLGSSKGRQTGDQPIPNAFYSQDRVMQRFRVKNDLLMSQIDDMDQVEHDEELSSDEETPRYFISFLK